MQIAITTTVKSCSAETLANFASYHLSIGFDYIFFFFDDENEIPPDVTIKEERIIIIKNDDLLQRSWQKTKLRHMLEYTSSDLIARQVLNIEAAINLSLQLNVSWILHIDVDELFYAPAYNNVKDHFKYMEQQHIQSINYVNYEAICEKTYIDNYYKEVTLFKRNPLTLTLKQKDLIQCHYPGGMKNFFLFYGNGKPAGKVSARLTPNGPHFFKNAIQFYPNTGPIILHYPVCGFENFYNKYHTLGFFPDLWLGEYSIEQQLPFHIRARNIIHSQTRQQAEKFYNHEVVISDQKLIEQLLINEIFCRIHKPSQAFK
ncbi:glycosyltransferase family 2 protein [Xanthocytophaga agilis]|uniref:Glycosyltransferase family 2 protein n=1 Tax=Xanthocytophaga agilis TaxID=3048010 RepID=A0AAE3R823_9BACT|nr:glycosyltransferase family 2 protein [Xanthocytophaga agilis]MDJ1503292.1 glycosyltransferase family 2 protein [Xanthocytophaga agilis]